MLGTHDHHLPNPKEKKNWKRQFELRHSQLGMYCYKKLRREIIQKNIIAQ